MKNAGQKLLRLRTLVTGGAGFLGSHLCARLIAEKNDVICLDNFFTGQKNAEELLANPNFELVRHDITFSYLAKPIRFNTPQLAGENWGCGDLFPHIRKDFREKS
jgi:UDP-glucuronate decarboxylase